MLSAGLPSSWDTVLLLPSFTLGLNYTIGSPGSADPGIFQLCDHVSQFLIIIIIFTYMSISGELDYYPHAPMWTVLGLTRQGCALFCFLATSSPASLSPFLTHRTSPQKSHASFAISSQGPTFLCNWLVRLYSPGLGNRLKRSNWSTKTTEHSWHQLVSLVLA